MTDVHPDQERAAQLRRDADALRSIAERAHAHPHLIDLAGCMERDAQDLWPHSISDANGEPGHYDSWSWHAELSGDPPGITLLVKRESRTSGVYHLGDQAVPIARAILALAEHPAAAP